MKKLLAPLLLTILLLAPLAARASTTVTVGTTADVLSSSPLSLRTAIANANNASAGSLPYIIQVPPGTYKLTLGQLNIGAGEGSGPANNILIVGTGTAASTVITQSDGMNRIFNLDPNIEGGQTFALANLTITGGHDSADGYGGAGVLTGQATAGVAQDFLFMTNCVITNNVTLGLARNGQPGPGAGLGSDGGSTTLVGCTFVKNTVSSATDGNLQGAGVTFQAWNAKDTLTAINCQFLQNAINASGPNQHAQGAGLHLQYESPVYPTARLTNCLFAGNVANMANYTGTGEADQGGGGLYLETGSTVSIIGCTFSNNAAIGPSGGPNSLGGNGGAILAAESQTSATIEFCRFVGNAGAAGGASNIWSSTATTAINANDNWWGSDAGPASGANVNLTALADWLFLTNTAAAGSVPVGGTDSLTVSFLKDSAGNNLTGGNFSALTNVPVTFTATDGSLTTAQALIQATGSATDTFTGTTGGSGGETATFDAASSTAAITVTPDITGISSSPTSAYYKAGQTVPIKITFAGNVTITGSPQLALADGGSAVYASGSGTATLVFDYVVAAGDTSSHLDYASTTALTLNGGTISIGGNPAFLTLPAPGTTGSLSANTTLVIDTTPPTIAIGAPSVTLAGSGSVTYTVTYADANFNGSTLASASITLNSTSTASAGSIVVSGTGATRTVTLSSLSGNGTLGISIAAGTASDLAGNLAPAASPSTTFTVYTTPPAITIGAPSATLTSTNAVSYTVTYTDPYFNTSTLAPGNLTVNSTGTAAAGSLLVSGTGTTRTVTLTGLSGNGTLGISLAAGTASDSAGNLAPAAGPSTTFTVDNIPPTLTFGSLNQTYDGGAESVTVNTQPSGLPTTVTYNGSANAPTNAGSYTVIGTVSYLSFTVNVTNTLVIAPAAQTITFAPFSDVVLGDAPLTLTATAGSGLSVSYASDTPSVATVSNNVLFLLSAGSATITASQAGNSNYLAAPNLPQPLVVQPFVLTLGIQPGPLANPLLTNAILSLTGNPNRVYSLIYSTNLLNPNWLVYLSTNLPAATINVPVPATNLPAQFFRLERTIWTP